MKFIYNKIYLLGVITLFINSVYTKKESTANDVEISNEDRYYLIYVNNTQGEYQIFSDSQIQKREESQVFIESLTNEINSLIIKNKHTYQNPEKLVEIEKSTQLNKRNNNENENQDIYNYVDSSLVYPISSVDNRVVLYAFLSNQLVEKVKALDNVIDCEPNLANIYPQAYYNEKDILAETKWKGLKVRSNADFHLSLISQGKFDKYLVKQYDTNYYYPVSAGKDVDIIVIDNYFNFDYSEFSNTGERTARCVASVNNAKVTTTKKLSCGKKTTFIHGEIITDIAAGIKHGAASSANIYGLAINCNSKNEYTDAEFLAGLQYISDHLIRSHKTIISISLSSKRSETSEYYKQLKTLVDSITNKGGIIVTSAGNDSTDIRNIEHRLIPCEYSNTICVGGINNSNSGNPDGVYQLDKKSNYGPVVDVYAPFYVKAEIKDSGSNVKTVEDSGTSYSTPLVAGMIATVISDAPNQNYDVNKMKTFLKNQGNQEKFAKNLDTLLLANNGKHIVYSRDSTYLGCGVHAGNKPCKESIEGRCGPGFGRCANPTDCCNKQGYCGRSTADHCDGKICQTEFGRCEASRCGPQYGKCPNNECCDRKGRCTTDSLNCSRNNGCQKDYGRCDPFRCGPNYGSCPDSECCSKNGICGLGSSFCGTGCNKSYGNCSSKTPTDAITPKKNKCGVEFGSCSKNDCCSQYNYCGTSEAHCGKGCQSKYGKCNAVTLTTNKPTSTTSKIPTSTDKSRCGPEYGRCYKSDLCCSKYNYCGTSDDHCKTGCQPKYGLCK